MPILRSATADHHHLVVRITVSDLTPVDLIAANRRTVDRSGALLDTNIRLRERIKPGAEANGILRYRSRKTLKPGSYYVQVLAIDTSGVTDCPHTQPNCLQHWSDIRRVLIT